MSAESAAADVGAPRAAYTDAIVRSLRIVVQAKQAHSRWVEKQCGVSAAQLWAMWLLHERSGERSGEHTGQGPGLRVSDLSELMSIHPSTTSNMLDKLQRKGLIRRERATVDQRVVRLHLTAEGERLLEAAPQPPQGHVTQAIQRLSDAQLAALAGTLDTLVEAMGDSGEPEQFYVSMPAR